MSRSNLLQEFRIFLISVSIFFSALNTIQAQFDESKNEIKKPTKLFSSEEALNLRMSYSNKLIRKKTNDSTYLSSQIEFKDEDGVWRPLQVNLRARGNFRRKTCKNVPLKIKMADSISKGTLFEGNKKLKMVLPCFSGVGSNDFVLKEYLAYKMYEQLAPYHFKVRLVTIFFTPPNSRNGKTRKLNGILIEDIKNVAKRYNGNVFKRHMQPAAHDAEVSVQNALFQFMIGNTDYSTTFQHNQKQIWAQKKIVPIPYDFDMSGFVNTDYAVVSKMQKRILPISDVTQRYFKGFQRDDTVYAKVRKSFIDKKQPILSLIEAHRPLFRKNMEYSLAKGYLQSFFKIIESDRQFEKNIKKLARPMPVKKVLVKNR